MNNGVDFMPPVIGLAQLLTIGFVCYAIVMVIYTIWALTHPPRQTYASAVHRSLPGDPGELESPLEFTQEIITGIKGELPIWIITGKNPDGPRVVFTHGWGSNRQGGLKRLEPFIETASEIILWDLPGHGDAQGSARMGTNEHKDLARVLDAMIDGHEKPTLLFGWSMGAGITIAFAHAYRDKYNILGIICESPYCMAITPARNVIRLKGVPYRINLKPAMMILGMILRIGTKWTGFDRHELVKTVDVPILIVHGQADPVSPIEDAQAIAHAASNATLAVIDEGGHNNLWTDVIYKEQTVDAIVGFIQ